MRKPKSPSTQRPECRFCAGKAVLRARPRLWLCGLCSVKIARVISSGDEAIGRIWRTTPARVAGARPNPTLQSRLHVDVATKVDLAQAYFEMEMFADALGEAAQVLPVQRPIRLMQWALAIVLNPRAMRPRGMSNLERALQRHR